MKLHLRILTARGPRTLTTGEIPPDEMGPIVDALSAQGIEACAVEDGATVSLREWLHRVREQRTGAA